MNLDSAIKRWCGNYLTLPFGYDDDKKYLNRPGKLMYRDSTSCSASYSLQDIYLLDDGTYDVYVDCGQARCTGGNREAIDTELKKCENLAEVLDYLMLFNGHDPNTTGELLLTIINNYQLKLDDEVTYEWNNEWDKRRFPILAKCGDNKSLIDAINLFPAPMLKHVTDRYCMICGDTEFDEGCSLHRVQRSFKCTNCISK